MKSVNFYSHCTRPTANDDARPVRTHVVLGVRAAHVPKIVNARPVKRRGRHVHQHVGRIVERVEGVNARTHLLLGACARQG